MSKENNGGYAFPSQSPIRATEMGATLRDYFAAKACLGLLTNSAYDDLSLDKTAEISYKMADAMLREREK